MDADDAAGSSRRMDLNLYLGLPRAPRPRRSDLGSDLALSTPMLSSPSSSAASVDAPLPPEPLHPRYSPSPADRSPPPPEVNSPYHPEDPPAPDVHLPQPPPAATLIPEQADDVGPGSQPQPQPRPFRVRDLLGWGWEDRPSSSTASSSGIPDNMSHMRRLFGPPTNRSIPPRRFRSDLPPLNSDTRPTGLEDVMPVIQHEPANETAEVDKVIVDGADVGASEESSKEQDKIASLFGCNICLDLASEPVVTSCGHLYCWPCLYPWINVYSAHKECPVCKGEVTEANITPIYGRGNSGGEKAEEDGNTQTPAIPPRPHGNRIESFRQQFHQLRPVSRRLGEAHGILSSWRLLLDQHIMNRVRSAGRSESAGQEVNGSAQQPSGIRGLGRFRARRLQRLADRLHDSGSTGPDSGMPANNASDPTTRDSTSQLPDGFNLLQHLAIVGIEHNERLLTARNGSRTTPQSQHGGSASSSNPQNPEPTIDATHTAGAPSADQASNSSTIAVIQGDAGVSESAGEPSNVSSRSLRRRARNNALGSLDVDGGGPQRNKRRRMN